MKECVTHYRACYCREAKFTKLETEFTAMQKELLAYKQTIKELEKAEDAKYWILDRVGKLLESNTKVKAP